MTRRLFHNILTYFLVGILLLATSCRKSGGGDDEIVTTPQTLIVYLAGTSLSDFFSKNVQDIESALQKGIQGKSRVVVVWQNSQTTKSEAMEITYDNGIINRKTIASYDLPQTMDSQTLGSIFKDVMQKAPAEAYGLIVGAHSWAWIPYADYPEVKKNKLTQAEAKLRLKEVELPRHMITRFIGDTGNGANRFDIETLSEALTSTGKQFEYILFDACFMANVEAVYDLRHNTKYIIGSACEIMGSGFPYTDTVPYLLQNGGTSYDLEQAAYSFHNHYKNTLKYSGTISLIKCSQLDALASAMKEVNKHLKDEYSLSKIQSYEGGTNHIFFDLGDYVDKACNDNNAKSRLHSQLEQTVSTKYTLDKFWSTYVSANFYEVTSFSGLSTSAPSILCRDSYEQTAWYKATH